MREQTFFASTSFAVAVLVAGTIGLAATPATARQNAQVQASTTLTSDTDAGAGGLDQKAEKKICRRIEQTGSRLSKHRVCLTAKDWRKVDEGR
jgi:hypothetical protein